MKAQPLATGTVPLCFLRLLLADRCHDRQRVSVEVSQSRRRAGVLLQVSRQQPNQVCSGLHNRPDQYSSMFCF